MNNLYLKKSIGDLLLSRHLLHHFRIGQTIVSAEYASLKVLVQFSHSFWLQNWLELFACRHQTADRRQSQLFQTGRDIERGLDDFDIPFFHIEFGRTVPLRNGFGHGKSKGSGKIGRTPFPHSVFHRRFRGISGHDVSARMGNIKVSVLDWPHFFLCILFI